MTPAEFDWGVIVPVAVAMLGLAGVYKTVQVQKGTRENKLIDQLQEELEAVRKQQRTDKEERAAERAEDQKRMSRLEQRDRVYIPHILKLNWHIEQGLGPPAPDIPDVVKAYLEENNNT